MAIPASLNKNLSLPVLCAPMFIVSNPDLVIAQCKSGVIGSFPALNARPKELLDEWLTRIKSELANDPNAAPFAVNQIIHASNERLEYDMAPAKQNVRFSWDQRNQYLPLLNFK